MFPPKTPNRNRPRSSNPKTRPKSSGVNRKETPSIGLHVVGERKPIVPIKSEVHKPISPYTSPHLDSTDNSLVDTIEDIDRQLEKGQENKVVELEAELKNLKMKIENNESRIDKMIHSHDKLKTKYNEMSNDKKKITEELSTCEKKLKECEEKCSKHISRKTKSLGGTRRRKNNNKNSKRRTKNRRQ
jgi:hypothetical protein